MKYRIPAVRTDLQCCFLDGDKVQCPAPATWTLQVGEGYEDFSESCDAHVHALLAGQPMISATRLKQPAVDHLDVVLDGPVGPECGRFVELEGFYGAFPPAKIESVGGAITWIEDDGLWRLRIPIPAGWLYG